MVLFSIKNIASALVTLGIQGALAQTNIPCSKVYEDITISQKSGSDISFQTDKAIKIPCTGDVFRIDFQVLDNVNTYFSISNKKNLESSKPVVGTVASRNGSWRLASEEIFEIVEIQNDSNKPEIIYASILVNKYGVSLLDNGMTVLSITPDSFDYEEFVSTGEYYVFFGSSAEGSVVSHIAIDCVNQYKCELPIDYNVCDNSYRVPSRVLTNKGGPVEYGLTPIQLPCKEKEFKFDFTVTTNVDIYVAFTGPDGLYSTDGVIETKLGYFSEKYAVYQGMYNKTKGEDDSFVNRNEVATIESVNVMVKYSYEILSVKVKNRLAIYYRVKNFDIKNAFIGIGGGSRGDGSVGYMSAANYVYCKAIDCSFFYGNSQ
ncbi:hypothetical protein AYI69_g8445 [Smittium culicis]|uniref:Uncharacterized protein n=1 Tax=Smittium culicis TaxID=133412 RepID=A0A1R1XJJ6_9FUNG|nr:hypothetical protein AYI69_g8445 [Smittium culicis]